MNYCTVATCIHCYLLLMATIVICHMSMCHMSAGNVNELLYCGYMYPLLPSVDGNDRNLSFVNLPYDGETLINYCHVAICIHCYPLLMGTIVI